MMNFKSKLLIVVSSLCLGLSTSSIASASERSPFEDKNAPVCSKVDTLGRADLENRIEVVNDLITEKAAENKDFREVAKEDIAFTQGYSSHTGEGHTLESLIGKSGSETYLVQRFYKDSAPESTEELKVSVLETNSDFETSSREVAFSSTRAAHPMHAPRTMCMETDWNCVKNKCGKAGKICILRGPAKYACMAIACAYVMGYCCKKWGVNPYQ